MTFFVESLEREPFYTYDNVFTPKVPTLKKRANSMQHPVLNDKHTGQLRKRILTDMDVRQGSVKGPACFLALYDIATWEVKTAGDRAALTAQQQESDPVFSVSDLKFMDDLTSFFEFSNLDELQKFIE